MSVFEVLNFGIESRSLIMCWIFVLSGIISDIFSSVFNSCSKPSNFVKRQSSVATSTNPPCSYVLSNNALFVLKYCSTLPEKVEVYSGMQHLFA